MNKFFKTLEQTELFVDAYSNQSVGTFCIYNYNYCQDAPSSLSQGFVLICKHRVAKWGEMLASSGSNGLFYKTMENNVWGNWEKIAFTS